jgi:hypothetical protein
MLLSFSDRVAICVNRASHWFRVDARQNKEREIAWIHGFERRIPTVEGTREQRYYTISSESLMEAEAEFADPTLA